eukprot:scaffold1087_cov198-Pinguiococcus_pyrenoidosus.AAC.26
MAVVVKSSTKRQRSLSKASSQASQDDALQPKKQASKTSRDKILGRAARPGYPVDCATCCCARRSLHR